MTDDKTYRVDRMLEPEPPPRPAGLLRCFPLGEPPAMTFFPLGPGRTVVGRAEGCDIRLEDQETSREHLVIEPRAEAFRATDNGSANGVYVGGQRVESRTLEDGAVIRVGTTLFRFMAPGLADSQHEIPLHEQGRMRGGPALQELRTLLD